MFINKRCLVFLFLIFFIFTQSAFAVKQTMGLIETAKISQKGIVLDAKLDTGADSCSLHANNIQEFEKNGKEYVKFYLFDRYGKKQLVEKEVIRHVRIKRLDGKSQVRKVIQLGLCLGNVYKIAEVSLVNRGKFNYAMLIGRRFLAGDFIIDPAVTYTQDPTCSEQDENDENDEKQDSNGDSKKDIKSETEKM